jgi:hypothetical protein
MDDNDAGEYVILPRLDAASPPSEENVVANEGFVILSPTSGPRDVELGSASEMEEDDEADDGGDDVSVMSYESEILSALGDDTEEPTVNFDDETSRYWLSDLVDRRVRVALGGGDSSVLIGVDGKTVYEMDAIAMRRQTDELLMFGAGARLVEKLFEAMSLACDCGGCDDCTRLTNLRSGREAIEWRDVAEYSILNWVFYAIELTSSTPRYDEDRLFWLANQRWDADTGEIVAPRLADYLKPPSLIDEAAQTLVVRIAEASDECARRRANYVARTSR